MIAINGTPMDQLDPTLGIVKHIESALTKIRTKKVWKFKFVESLIIPPKAGVKDSYLESPQGINLLAQQKYNYDGRDWDVAYFERTRTDKMGRLIFRPKHVDYKGYHTLYSKKQSDLIFFYLCLSPYCQSFPLIESYQSNKGKAPMYFVEDLKAEALEQKQIEKEVLRIQDALYGDNGLDEDKIREIASQMKIPNATNEEYDIDILRKEIRNRVLAQKMGKYNTKAILNFLQILNSVPDVRVMKIIDTAFELDIVKMASKLNYPSAYYILDVDTEKETKLCDVVKNQQANQCIYDAIITTKAKIREIEKANDSKLSSVIN